jgi:hypothetical protein
MQEFAMEHPIVTLLIVLALLPTVRVIIPWARHRSSADDE